MNEVWKYRLRIVGGNTIEMPRDATTLTVAMQDGHLTAWALVDPRAEREGRKFIVTGTGIPIELSNGTQYIGTVQDGVFVWHVFEERA